MGTLLQFPGSVDFGARFSERILARLTEAEAHGPNPHLRCDYRIAFRTVLHSARGDAVLCTPYVLATYEVLGCHPDHVWRIVQYQRIAKLGNEFADCYDKNGNLRRQGLDNIIPDFDPTSELARRATPQHKRAGRV